MHVLHRSAAACACGGELFAFVLIWLIGVCFMSAIYNTYRTSHARKDNQYMARRLVFYAEIGKMFSFEDIQVSQK